jgi:hypothetical protein
MVEETVSECLTFVLIDETAGGTIDGSPLTLPILEQMCEALAKFASDVASEWGGDYQVRPGRSVTDYGPGECPCFIARTIQDQAPGAAAFHDILTGWGQPVIYAGLDEFDSFLSGGSFPLSEALGHEVAETIVDRPASFWSDRGDGTEEALEDCDRLQGSTYMEGSVVVPNWLLRSAFNPNGVAPFEYVGATTGKRVIANRYDKTPEGYAILRTVGGNLPNEMREHLHGFNVVRMHQVFIDAANPALVKRALHKQHPASRSHRRGVRLGLAA